MLRAGLYGFGGIAQAHKKAYEINAAAGLPVEVVAACDITLERLHRATEINISLEGDVPVAEINRYNTIDEMLANEELDIISICLPTYLHADAAIAMLEKGYHVLSEKPMALSSADCARMIAAADKAKGHLMIGQCMRFRPEYIYIKELVESGKYGRVVSAYFNRLANPPIWAWQNWFMDPKKSGGCILDLHIHDIDIIRFIFGDPAQISCLSHQLQCQYDSNHTRFVYEDGKTVVAVGDWSLSRGFKFEQNFRVAFEGATVVYNGNTVTLYEGDNAPVPAPIKDADGIVEEIAYFVSMIADGVVNTVNTPKDSAGTIALVEKMMQSADAGGVLVDIGGQK